MISVELRIPRYQALGPPAYRAVLGIGPTTAYGRLASILEARKSVFCCRPARHVVFYPSTTEYCIDSVSTEIRQIPFVTERTTSVPRKGHRLLVPRDRAWRPSVGVRRWCPFQSAAPLAPGELRSAMARDKLSPSSLPGVPPVSPASGSDHTKEPRTPTNDQSDVPGEMSHGSRNWLGEVARGIRYWAFVVFLGGGMLWQLTSDRQPRSQPPARVVPAQGGPSSPRLTTPWPFGLLRDGAAQEAQRDARPTVFIVGDRVTSLTTEAGGAGVPPAGTKGTVQSIGQCSATDGQQYVVHWEGAATVSDVPVAQRSLLIADGGTAAEQAVEALARAKRLIGTSPERAFRWSIRAAELGNTDGMEYLGRHYLHGKGVNQDDTAACSWFRRAAEMGNAEAMDRLGWMYVRGRGVALDYVEAIRWYRRAADAGSGWGMAHMGRMYADGLALPVDDAAAIGWFRRAAEAGNAYGMFCLGQMYEAGRGVQQDQSAADGWYRKAAELGDPQAKELLEKRAKK